MPSTVKDIEGGKELQAEATEVGNGAKAQRWEMEAQRWEMEAMGSAPGGLAPHITCVKTLSGRVTESPG